MSETSTGGQIVSAATDSAINPRHNIELLGAVLIGTQIADQDQVEAIITLLNSVGISENIQLILGGVALVCARLLSWRKSALAKARS